MTAAPQGRPDFSIITPCSRESLLEFVAGSIDFKAITRWVIVYDVHTRHVFDNRSHPKIVTLQRPNTPGVKFHQGQSRNLALKVVPSGLVYFLDDDNTMHSNFWRLLPLFEAKRIYTFDQIRMPGRPHQGRLSGQVCHEKSIDMGQVVLDRDLIGNAHFTTFANGEDGRWLGAVCKEHPKDVIYLPFVLSHYNSLRLGGTGCRRGCLMQPTNPEFAPQLGRHMNTSDWDSHDFEGAAGVA